MTPVELQATLAGARDRERDVLMRPSTWVVQAFTGERIYLDDSERGIEDGDLPRVLDEMQAKRENDIDARHGDDFGRFIDGGE